MKIGDVSLAVLTLYALSTTVLWISVVGWRLHAKAETARQDNSRRAIAARPAKHDGAGTPGRADHREVCNAPSRCPVTGRPCEGDRAHLCADYGCARKAGLSPHSAENL